MGVVLLLLKQYWQPILISLLVAGVLGSFAWKNHRIESLKEDVAVYKVKLQQAIDEKDVLRNECIARAKVWNEQVKKLQAELEASKKEKEEIVQRNLRELYKKQSELDKERKKSYEQIQRAFGPSDNITVPFDFVRLYNEAVARSAQASEGHSPEASVSEDRPGSAGETETFNAATFSQVVVGNVDEYNALATRCAALVEVVTELEGKTYGGLDPD